MITHGLSKHPLYNLWRNIKKRCNVITDMNYKWYGGKGIKMSLKWESNFKHFYDWCLLNGWERGLTIDRINNEKGYLPENCSFITRSLNSKKRHQSSPLNHKDEMNPNAKLTIELVKQLRNDLTNKVKIKDLLAIYNISQTQLYRIKNGVRWNSSPLV